MEDLNFHAGEEAGHPAPIGALRFLLDIAFATAFSHPNATTHIGLDAAFVHTVDRVEFVRHAALLWKRDLEPDPAQARGKMKRLVEVSGSAANWFHYIYYALNRGGSLEESEVAARHSIALGNDSGPAHWRLSDILERRGNLAEALAAAERARILAPDVEAIKERVERLKRRIDHGS